jgi:tetratricopeptide (TPR) repeat protein
VGDNPRVDDLRRRLEREPGSRVFAQLAEELRKSGQLPEAIRVARQGLLNHPGYPSARMTLGRALLDSRDLRGARSEFEAVLRGAPDNILASRYLAECLEALGDLGSALLQYRATSRLSPGDRNIEAQIKGLEERLTPGSVAAAESPAAAPARRPELARPGVIPVLEVDGPMELETALESAPRWGASARFEGPSAPPPESAPAPASLPLAPPPPPPPAPTVTAPPGDAEDSHVFALPAVPPVDRRPVPEPVAPAPPPAPPPVEVPPVAVAAAPAYIAPTAPSAPEATTAFVPDALDEEFPQPAPPSTDALAGLPFPEFPAPARPTVPEVPAPAPSPPAPPVETPQQPLYSSTLAELYFQQGFTRQAIEVYQELLAREPSNGRLQARLHELRAIEREEGALSPPAPVAAPADSRARRRESITRTIARLEGLMHAARRL